MTPVWPVRLGPHLLTPPRIFNNNYRDSISVGHLVPWVRHHLVTSLKQASGTLVEFNRPSNKMLQHLVSLLIAEHNMQDKTVPEDHNTHSKLRSTTLCQLCRQTPHFK